MTTSFSSDIISNITAFRNPNGPEQEWTKASCRKLANSWKVCAAEIGYIGVVPFAVIETALLAIAKVFSVCLPIGQKNHDKMSDLLKSSAFSIIWALGDSAINLFCNDMIETESVAKACAVSGKIFEVPKFL